MGTITKVSSQPAKQSILLFDGTYKICDVPNRVDVTLTVKAEAVKKERNYLINRSYEALMGTTRAFKTKYANVNGKITNISE